MVTENFCQWLLLFLQNILFIISNKRMKQEIYTILKSAPSPSGVEGRKSLIWKNALCKQSDSWLLFFCLNLILMCFGMSFVWFTPVAGIASLIIGIWLFKQRNVFSWNNQALFNSMLIMVVIGFSLFAPNFLVSILYALFGTTSFSAYLWWAVIFVPSVYPFWIVYTILSSIVLYKMWRFHGKYAHLRGSNLTSVGSSGGAEFYVWLHL